MRTTAIAGAMIACLLAPTRAAPQAAGPGLSGSFELGARGFLDALAKEQLGKLNEYKDLPGGGVVQQFALALASADSLRKVSLVGRRIGAIDQSTWFRFNQPGLFDFQVRTDRIPHTFSTTARQLGAESSPGIYTLPTPRPDTATLNHSPYLGPVRTTWDPVKVSLAMTPGSNWDMKAEYTHIAKTGGRPMGMAFGGPSNNAREILEPIDQTVQGVRLTQSYAEPRFQLIGTYDLSAFTNHLSSVMSDNPLATADAATTGGSRGRTALAPSNVAHTIAATGALNLPLNTRITSTGTYGWWRQNEPFIAATVNTAISDPRINQEPQSLGGVVQTSLFSASLSSRPFSPLNVTGHFRSYVFRDHAISTKVPLLVVNDRSISPADSGERDPYRKDNADVGATWRLPIPITLGGAVTWEQMDLDSATRNVSRYTERSPRVTADFTGLDWASLRASYSKAWRRTSSYHQVDAAVMPQFERLDLADRDRERLNLMGEVTPLDPVTIGGMWQVGHDLYPSSAYGLQSDKNWAAGGDISVAAAKRLTLGAGYTREVFQDVQRNRYRTGTLLTNSAYDWIAQNMDYVTTTSANANFIAIPDRLELGGTFELSHSRFRMAAMNPTTPTGGTAAQNLSATASDFPDVTQTLQPFNLFARYYLKPEWAMIVRYQAELYSQNDFRTLGLQPATGNFIFLGNNFLGYNARFLTVSVSYRPPPLRVGRSTI